MIRRHPVASYFALAYAISWLLWSPLWLPAFGVRGLPVIPFHHALGALGPISAAFLMAALTSGRAGVSDLLRRMVFWRGQAVWLAVALLGPFAMLALVALVAWIAGEQSLSLAGVGVSREFPQFSALAFLLYNIVSFGYGEEVGWRGFALPRLQTQRSALSATLLLFVGWAVWHLPLFAYRPGYTDMGVGGVVGWLVSLLTGAILLSWLYNSSLGSLLVAALFHATIDVAFTSDVTSPFMVNGTGALVTIWGVLVLVLAGPRSMSRSGKVVFAGRATTFLPKTAKSDVASRAQSYQR